MVQAPTTVFRKPRMESSIENVAVSTLSASSWSTGVMPTNSWSSACRTLKTSRSVLAAESHSSAWRQVHL